MPADSRVRGLAPLLLLAVVVVLTVWGLALGLWLENLHNALLAVTFSFVGAYVLFERPRHREGLLFIATGAVHAAMFLGRQIGHFTPDANPLWGWLGVWPLAPALALATLSVLCFPDGALRSPRWRPIAIAVVVDAAVIATGSAIWPVGYASAGVSMPHPFTSAAPMAVEVAWNALSYPSFIAFQALWVVAIVDRWVHSNPVVRRQLIWLGASSAISVIVLVVGLVVWGSPRGGILLATLLPISAGWAIVHGQHVAAYSALTWLSRGSSDPRRLPELMARNTAEAMRVGRVILWIGDEQRLHAVGVWPDDDAEPAPSTLAELESSAGTVVRAARRGDDMLGALSLHRPEPLSRSESRLFADLASQAALVLEHLSLAELINRQETSTALAGLTRRERDVLALIARGFSNAAICTELHLSVKTIEPTVSTIFAKLGLQSDSRSNRRVLAALEYLRSAGARPA